MQVKVWYFARIKEALNCEKEELQLPAEVKTLADLIDFLSARGNDWRNALQDRSLLVAVNQAVASRQTTIAEGDEIAFFPPVTGG